MQPFPDDEYIAALQAQANDQRTYFTSSYNQEYSNQPYNNQEYNDEEYNNQEYNNREYEDREYNEEQYNEEEYNNNNNPQQTQNRPLRRMLYIEIAIASALFLTLTFVIASNFSVTRALGVMFVCYVLPNIFRRRGGGAGGSERQRRVRRSKRG
ncbi:hypothetical protein F4678DRAFT_461091 [Xylaria arbuscula]|nr:hypothetical protein F4678DRAFT_461091 [Xylaria arbuscula]